MGKRLHRTAPALGLAVALALAGSACSTGSRAAPKDDNPHKWTTGDPVSGPPTPFYVAPDGKAAAAKGKGVASPTPFVGLGVTVTPRPDGSYDIPNFVKAETPDYESWEGATCRPPKPGALCRVRFIGAAYLKQDRGSLVILAAENGSSKIAAQAVLPATKEWNRINEWLTYQIGLDAKYVTFWVELRDSSGKVLAKNFPQRVPIRQM